MDKHVDQSGKLSIRRIRQMSTRDSAIRADTRGRPGIDVRGPADPRYVRWRSVTGSCLLLLVFASALSAPGCGGCSRNPQAQKKAEDERRRKEAEQQDKKKEKPPFEFGKLVVEPWDDTTGAAAVKPGHWTATSQLMKANLNDFHGELALSVTDKSGRPVFVDRTRFQMTMTRPVVLSKGRDKRIETTFITPPQSGTIHVKTALRRSGGGEAAADATSCLAMPSYQYYFVVLAKNPRRYAYIKTLPSVRVPIDTEDESGDDQHYRVVAPDADKGLALPSNPLAWTSIAYVLWDEMAPDQLSPEQQQALVDWMHWGGQLIVSGPDSMDLLRKSFLEPYLPAEGGKLRQFTQDDLTPLSATWTLTDRRERTTSLQVTAPWSGLEIQPKADAISVPGSGGMLVEGQVGRGRVVVSAFQLDERDLLTWRGNFDNFFNACLLRRPARRWSTYDAGAPFDTLNWAATSLQGRRRDARLVSNLRFFSRDTGINTNWNLVRRPIDNQWLVAGSPQQATQWLPSQATGGVGAWNDFSLAANEAREVLRLAAGVQVPRASFVVGVLAAYLLVLVPLNWLVFYTVGRLEWAWIAAPVIAAIGTVVVVWQAQLDIGFVRSQTEIGVLELQGDHPRGHLTRYTAVYTSLGTAYDFKFDDPTALVAPFPDDPQFTLLAGQQRDEVLYRKHEDVRLTDLGVRSSSTSLVHSEQMFNVGGPIRLGTSSRGHPQVENLSDYDLVDVAVLQRTQEGLKGCWIGNLRARSSSIVALATLGREVLDGSAFAQDREAAASSRAVEPLNLDRLIHLAQRVVGEDGKPTADPDLFPVDEVRLVGRIDRVLPGLSIEPEASQTRGAVLVVAHLEHPKLPSPASDANSKPHLSPKTTLELEDTEWEGEAEF